MKKTLIRYIFLFTVISLLLTNCFAAYAEDNEISSDEALAFSLLYYYGNLPSKETISIDSYILTPLYDKDQKLTHYCFDFFEKDEDRGYVVISADASYVLCPELSYENSSTYYSNQDNELTNIYYNPLEKYTLKKKTKNKPEKFYSEDKQEISKKNINGNRIKGERKNNTQLRDSIDTTIFGDAAPSGNFRKVVFEQHPSSYLETLGFTNIATYTYGTLEPQMIDAGAFHPMYSYNNSTISTGVYLPNGIVLKNPGHCVITAITNVLRFWRIECCQNYPSNYEDLFAKVCKIASTKGYFNPQGNSGVSASNVDDLLLAVNKAYSYDGRVITSSGYWEFLTKYIKNYNWPVIIGFTGENFTYDHHAVVAFGYNVMTCSRTSETYAFKFVKVNDGWADTNTELQSGKVTPTYISWEIARNFGVTSKMYAFCPYK